MSILQSCCCWRSVRKGSFASAIYTIVYYAFLVMVCYPFIHEERDYYQGNSSSPQGNSILEEGTISHMSMWIAVLMVFCSICGIIASFVLLYALYTNKSLLLLPWIVTLFFTLLLDMTHSIYLFAQEVTRFNPLTAMIFTIDFFLLALNIYAMLCVISQYQEYLAGRGTADDEEPNLVLRIPTVRYNANVTQTGTSCMNNGMRRDVTYLTTRASPTMSHAEAPSRPTTLAPPPTSTGRRVNFTDHVRGRRDDKEVYDVVCITDSDAGGKSTPGVDTVPLLVSKSESAM